MWQVLKRDEIFILFERRQEMDVPLETETSAVCET